MSAKKHTAQSVTAIACALVSGITLSAQRRSPQGAPSPAASGLNGYSVVFVVGDSDMAGKSDPVPAAAQNALNNMQAFLPYKHYQLLDSAWILCCSSFGETTSARIKGPDGREYQYSIRTSSSGEAGRFSVHFSLTESGATGGRGGRGGRGVSVGGAGLSDEARADYSRQLYEATKDRDEARLSVEQAKRRMAAAAGPSDEVRAAQIRLDEAELNLRKLEAMLAGAGGAPTAISGASLMDNSFFIAPGETVVIGTSRVNGGQALIALLTAVPKSGRKE